MMTIVRHYTIITLYLSATMVVTMALSTLNCDFDKILSTYSCNPISISPPIAHENEEISVKGIHLADHDDDDVTYLRFNRPLTMHFVPTALFGIFTNIETFGLQNVGLTNVTSNAFSNCYKLKSLTIESNEKLREIPANFAEDCASLQNLYLPANGIESIDKNSFVGLENLLYLVLTKNHIERLHADTFSRLHNLRHLFLDFNRLKQLESNLFQPLRNLQLLSATHNSIEEISLALFRNNPILDSIFLDHNEIVAIDGAFFEEFPGRRESYEFRFCHNNCTNAVLTNRNDSYDNRIDSYDFDLCIENWNRSRSTLLLGDDDGDDFDNNIEVSTDALSLSSSLSPPSTTVADTKTTPANNIHEHNCRFFLDENRKYTCVLECVDLVLTAIGGAHYENFGDQDVTHVHFAQSTLSRVPRIIFRKFPNLEFLSVARTDMTIIDDQTFGECGEKLRRIDASGNRIMQIVETSLRNCKALRTIDVSGNPIEFVGGELFTYDPQLKHVILHKKFGRDLDLLK